MPTSITSFKIWVITVCLNAFLFGIIELLLGKNWLAVSSVIVLIIGFIIGFPFWFALWLLTDLVLILPYSAIGRMSWVAGILGILVALLYATIGLIITGHFGLSQSPLGLLTGTTIAALILALCWNQKAFAKEKAGNTITKSDN